MKKFLALLLLLVFCLCAFCSCGTEGKGQVTSEVAQQNGFISNIPDGYKPHIEEDYALVYPSDWQQKVVDGVMTFGKEYSTIKISYEDATAQRLEEIESMSTESFKKKFNFGAEATIGVEFEGIEVTHYNHNGLDLTVSKYKESRSSNYSLVTECYFCIDSRLYTLRIYEYVENDDKYVNVTDTVLESLTKIRIDSN